jgi:predicted nucleic acid-binding protein
MKVYYETSILADWFFVRTVKPRTRGKLKSQVLASHELIEHTLRGKFQDHSFLTSVWALVEAVGVLKRARVEFNLFRDNISLAYYGRLKDQEGFKLEEADAQELDDQMKLLMRRAARQGRLRISGTNVEWADLVNHITRRCLDPTDALHLAIALAEKCDVIVTRDREFLERKKSLRTLISLAHPQDLLPKLAANARKQAK